MTPELEPCKSVHVSPRGHSDRLGNVYVTEFWIQSRELCSIVYTAKPPSRNKQNNRLFPISSHVKSLSRRSPSAAIVTITFKGDYSFLKLLVY
jgi:hypothetical protein